MLIEIAKGDFTAALRQYKKTVPFPGIISRICDQPCQDVCKRAEAGDAIAIRNLERACVDIGESSSEKSRPLPKRGGKIAVIGGGVSGLTAAYDLARKGYAVTIIEAGSRLGGSLWKVDRDFLPAKTIEDDVNAVIKLGVVIRLNTPINQELHDLRRDFNAIYVAIGAHTVERFDLDQDEYGFVKVDAVTFATSMDGVFAGGGLRWGKEMHSAITSISEGRRAAISIDRYLQKVSLTASRINEGTYPSCLYTNMQGIEPHPVIDANDHQQGYEWNEAIQEAKRCLQCECMECVKVCEYLKQFERYPKRYVREIYNNLSIVKGTRHTNTFINSCSLCGLCGEICPEHLDMASVNLTARREMVEQNRMPPSAFDFALRDMQFSNSDKFELARNRPGTDMSDIVFFPGCQLSASSPDHVELVYAYLNNRLTNSRVGLMLGCCGAPANWAGQSALFESTLAAWRTQLQAMGNPKVILPCSSCYQVFKNHMPGVEIVSLWEIYDQCGLPAFAGTVEPANCAIAIHDPCTTRYETSIQDSVRRIVHRLGYQIEELPLSRERTECCSYGGLMWLSNRELARKVIERRVAASQADYVTYCAMCRDFFASHGKRALHLLDLIYNRDTPGVSEIPGVSAQTTDERAARRGPGYSQRHENRARLKRKLLKTIWGEDMDGAQAYESIRLIIADEVRVKLEQRLILTEDIQRVVEYAERTGRRLLNQGTGHTLAYFKPTSVTYWVEYLRQADGFAIYNAYSHRMEVPGSGQLS